MNKNGILIEAIVVIVFLIIGFFWFTSSHGMKNGLGENQTFNDALKKYADEGVCVPATCCHATSCVSLNEAPNCSQTLCTQECENGTMDCGQGSCEFIEGGCQVVWK